MSTTDRPRVRRLLAAVLSTALVATGAVALTATPAAAAYPETVNPFAIAGGFTIYAREDALLRNQETEGSIAVGDTATVQGSSGQYTIIHVSAGTGAYDLPTVDDNPTRFLVGSYSTTSTGILAITSAGTTDPDLLGDLKMVQRDGPWQAFQRSDWLRLNQNPSNPDQTPLIDATHQRYPQNAAPPEGTVGANGAHSIYTLDTSATAVANYVEANREASWEEAAMCLGDIADPTAGIGYPVGVADDEGDRVVLEPLSPDMPNVVDYADIAGAALIQFSDGPTPGAANPLVIRVPRGTTEVIGARADPQGAYSPYMLWDLSLLVGDVTVTAAQARIDGSIYAPEADVTVNAAPLDGQVIGRDVTIEGGEVHSYLFSSEVPCTPDSGTFSVRKALSGIDAGDLPPDTTFTVNYTATEPDGTIVPGTLEIPADGTPVDAGLEFPLGTVVEFEEIAPETVPGWEWGPASVTPNPLTIGSGSADVVVSNTATELTGTFSVVKSVDFLSGDPVDLPEGISVPAHWTAWDGLTQIAEGTIEVPLDGTVVDVGQQFPVGTRIVLTEDLTGVTPPDGYEWSTVGWDPGRTFVIEEQGTVAVELTNGVTPIDDGRSISIVKSATGTAADDAYGYAVSYNTGTDTRGTMALPIGDPQLLADVDPEADTLELAELVPTLNGQPTDPADWKLPVILVTVDGVTTEYTPTAFDEGQADLTDAIVDIPLPASGDIAIEVDNALREGTFDVSKAFENIPEELIPDDLEFSVTWTATLPTGEVERGTIRVPADGTAVGPETGDGAPATFPYGTVITFGELTAPTPQQIAWETRTFDPEQLVIGDGGAAVVHTTLTNRATLITGTFQVSKALAGIDPELLPVDSFTIDYTAHFPGQDPQAGSFEIPADGTLAGPTDENGGPVMFPIGTIVNVTEVAPDPADLPEGYAWSGSATWTPASWVLIGPDETPTLQVTNSVVELTRYSAVKRVDGDAASSVPTGTTFPLEWWVDDVAQPTVQLTPDVVVYSPYYPAGTIVAVREGDPPPVPGVDWGIPTWTVDGQALTPDDEGRYTLPVTPLLRGATVEVTVTNTADTTPAPTPPAPLPATGGGGVSPLVPLGALAAITLGALLAIRRTRRTHDV